MAIEVGGRGVGDRELTPAVIIPGGGRDWGRFMLKLGLTTLILVVVISLVLFVWQSLILNARLTKINNEIKGLEAAQQSQAAQKFIVVQSQLRSLREILTNHVYASKIFAWLESLTHKQVSFSNTSMEFKGSRISIKGLAASHEVLAEQIIIFENDSNIVKVEVQSIQIGSQGVGFSLNIEFDKSLTRR
jgi:hypothetical protein